MTVSRAADLAGVRFLTRMRESMLLQILETAKGFAAGLTVIIRFAGMRSDVGLESARLGKGRAAVLTDERPVARVGPLMIDAVRVGREAAAAVLAHVRLVTRVRSHVEHEPGVLPERLAAYVTEETLEVRILLLLGALVNSQMPLQLDLLLERLVALLACVQLRLLVTLLMVILVFIRAILVLPAVCLHLMLQQRFLRVVRFSTDFAGKALALVVGIQFFPDPTVYQLDRRLIIRWSLWLRTCFALIMTVSIHVTLQPVLSDKFHVADVTDEFLVY